LSIICLTSRHASSCDDLADGHSAYRESSRGGIKPRSLARLISVCDSKLWSSAEAPTSFPSISSLFLLLRLHVAMLFSVCERVAFLLVSLWLLPFAQAKGECYTPVVNGTAQLADEQEPCDPYAYISLCCPVGWTCFSNSVCVVTDTSSPDVQDPLGTTTRGGCTNPLWDTASCGNICLGTSNPFYCLLRKQKENAIHRW